MTMKPRQKRTCRVSTLVVFFSIFCALLLPHAAGGASVTYQLREEQAPGTFVGNIEKNMLLQGELDPHDARDLKYTLSSAGNAQASLFDMNETSSTITTAQKIDREEVCPGSADCEITLSIAVYKRSASTLDLFKLWTAVVNIVDINDNAPKFPQPFVTLSVPESVPPMHVLHTSGAEDKDKGGTNSVKGYELSPPNPLFDLNVVKNPDGTSDLGIVIKEQLDREKQGFYKLKVLVMDGGYPRKTGSLTVNITVADINDERPTFVKSTYNVTIKENVSPDSPILQVTAFDRDVGLNGDVSYSFSPRVSANVKNSLQIDPSTGVISARGPIDYEKTTRYQFIVEAKDKGNPQLSGSTVVILNVEDVNDNSPQININLTPGGTNLSESELVGKFIAHVSVSDRDSGQNGVVICSMDDDHFSLQKFYDHAYNMYKVLLSHKLDYETTSMHRLTITCRDRGVPVMANSTSFNVHVTDVNDNDPIFSQKTYTASVIENKLDVLDLLQVSAHDYDTGLGGEVDFALDSRVPNVTRIFQLDSRTGVLQIRSPLNREDRGQYVFHVLAFDRGTPRLSSSATIIVTVQDENDEKPYFPKYPFNLFVMERKPAGTVVGNVSANDLDSSAHSTMHYSLVSGVGDYQFFSIDAGTGVIRSRVVFDREEKAFYRLQVKVEDPAVPLFYDLTNVTVEVTDDNDNPPVIHYPREGNNTVNVSYGVKVGWLVTVINATDIDHNANGKLTFFVADGDAMRLFKLDRRSGALRLARSLTPADVRMHLLEVQVQDGGDPPLFAIAELYVQVVAGNVTLLALNSDDQDQNMLIVIVLVCVTGVLALAVLVTICLIRRIDKERTARREASKAAEEEKMFHLKNQDAFLHLSNRESSPGSGDGGSGGGASSGGGGDNSSASGGGGGHVGGGEGKAARKKEVSFSVDEGVDSLNSSTGGSGHALSTFKSPTEKHKDWNTSENCLSVNCPPLRSDPGMLNIPVGHRMSAEDNHLHTVQEEEEACRYMDMLKRAGTGTGEDALSESSGETGTSDSGRGGSEDDSHSNRGSANIDQDGHSIYPNLFIRGSSGVVGRLSGADTHPGRPGGGRHLGGARSSFNSSGTSGSGGRPLRQHSPHVSFSGNLEYLGESSTDYDSGGFPPPPDLLYEAPPPPPPPMPVSSSSAAAEGASTNFSTFGQPAPRSNSYRSVLHTHPRSSHAGYGGVSTSLVKNSGSGGGGGGGAGGGSGSASVTPSSSPLVMEEVGGGGGGGGAGVAGRGRQRWVSSPSFNDDDDRTTSTTSGSYVVADDLRKEIDELILNDMIV